MKRSVHIFYGLLLASLFVTVRTAAQQGAKNGEWRVYGGDEGSTRYSPLDQINRDNIKNMRIAWIWKSDSLMYRYTTGVVYNVSS